MAYSLKSKILSKSSFGPADIRDVLGYYPSDSFEYLVTLDAVCDSTGVNFAIASSQSAHETANWDLHNPRWVNHNPAGLLVESDDDPDPAVLTLVEAARVHVWCLAYACGVDLRPKITLPLKLDKLVERWVAKFADPNCPQVETIEDLGIRYVDKTGEPQATWGWDSQYANKLVNKINYLFPRNEVSMPVLSGVVIKAQACPIEIWVVDQPQKNRPALAMPDTSFVTIHEVGNLSPGADEDMHAQFVHNGGGQYSVSFHFIVGPTKVIQLIYLNENAWHASDYYGGRGNRDSWAIETVQIGDFGKTLSHLAYLTAELFRNPSRFSYRSDIPIQDDLDPKLYAERMRQHHDWAPDLKNCPQFIRDRGLWVPLVSAVGVELAKSTSIPAPAKKYSSPILPNWWSDTAIMELQNHRDEDGILYKPMGTRVTAIKNTGAYAHPWKPEGKGKRTRSNIVKGETVDLRFRASHPETKKQWGITRHGTWIALDNFTPRITLRSVAE